MYTLDTNVLIYYLDGDARVKLFLDPILKGNYALYVSAITAVELLAFPKVTLQEMQRIEVLLSTVHIVSVDSFVARIAAEIRREHGLKVPDAYIAATALSTRTTLLTRNVRDFRELPMLSLEEI